MDIFKQRWQEIKSKIRQKWNKLSEEDVHQINGKRDQLINKLHSKYGWEQRRAEAELERFENSLQGERGQKIRPEYNREGEEDIRKQYDNEENNGKKTQKYKREYFDRLDAENEEGSNEGQDFPKRKIH